MFNQAYAHSAHGVKPLLWSGDISWHIVAILILLTLIYSRGFYLYYQRKPNANKRSYILNYYLGILTLLIALVGPIDTFSDHLAWVHMLQHTLILMIAAPLIAFSAPSYIFQWFLSRNLKIRSDSYLFNLIKLTRFNRPLIAWLLYCATLWVWHIPFFYEAALDNEIIHDFQHITFFITSFYFWRVLFDPFQRKKIKPILGVMYCFISSLHGILLGVLMALSPEIWYKPYISPAIELGYDPLVDQQIAGFIMWMPAGLSYALGSLYLLGLLFKRK